MAEVADARDSKSRGHRDREGSNPSSGTTPRARGGQNHPEIPVPTVPPIHPELLEILCCPETRQPVEEVSPALVKALNEAIRRGEIRSGRGSRVKADLSSGLVRSDGRVVYPVRNGIPIMLIEDRLEVPASLRSWAPEPANSEEEIADHGDADHHQVKTGPGA